MKRYDITVTELTFDDENGNCTKQTEIYSQVISEEYANENPTWLSRVIAVINCLPFPLLTITEPKEK